MKKILVITSALVLAFALAGCGSSASSSASSASSSSASSASASSTSSSSSSSSTTNWTKAATGTEAAKGAGLSTFGVPATTMIADINFTNPTFGYTTGAAQATYETGAAALTVRKADSSHASLLTDKATSEFANNWKKTYEGIEVTCYGPARGASAFATWASGGAQYGVTIQGLGGEELTMDDEDINDIVRGMISSDVATSGTSTSTSASASTSASMSASTSASTSSSTNNGFISEDAAKNAAVSAMGAGLPEQVTAQLVVGGDAPHYVVTMVWTGTESSTVSVDAYTGQVWTDTITNGTGGSTAGNGTASTATGNYISQNDAIKAAIDSVGGGIPETASAELVTSAGNPYYSVTIAFGTETHIINVDATTGAIL